MIVDSKNFALEEHCRRRDWRLGLPIRLADGLRWHLPAVGPTLLASVPDLEADIREARALAKAPQAEGETDQENIDELCRFHGRLSSIAIRMLGLNYELPEYCWGGLFVCDDRLETFRLTVALGFAIDHAIGDLAIGQRTGR